MTLQYLDALVEATLENRESVNDSKSLENPIQRLYIGQVLNHVGLQCIGLTLNCMRSESGDSRLAYGS